MSMIIDPPVTPFSGTERIQNWINYLETLRRSPDLTPDETPSVDRAIREALHMLKLSAGGAVADARARELSEGPVSVGVLREYGASSA